MLNQSVEDVYVRGVDATDGDLDDDDGYTRAAIGGGG